jgi:hypothetical protein
LKESDLERKETLSLPLMVSLLSSPLSSSCIQTTSAGRAMQ